MTFEETQTEASRRLPPRQASAIQVLLQMPSEHAVGGTGSRRLPPQTRQPLLSSGAGQRGRGGGQCGGVSVKILLEDLGMKKRA